MEQRSADRRPTAAPDSESSGAARQKNRSSSAAKLARETMPIETSNSLASIGRRYCNDGPRRDSLLRDSFILMPPLASGFRGGWMGDPEEKLVDFLLYKIALKY